MGTASNNTGGDLCCQDSPKGIGPVTCDMKNVQLAFGLVKALATTANDMMAGNYTSSVDDVGKIGKWAESLAMPKCINTNL
jgi:hypothetical protein